MAYVQIDMHAIHNVPQDRLLGWVLMIHPVEIGDLFRGSVWHNCGVPRIMRFYPDR